MYYTQDIYTTTMQIGQQIISIWLLIWAILWLIYLVWIFVSMIRRDRRNHWVPTLNTFAKHKQLMQDQLELKDQARILDLGCGYGSALRFFDMHFDCAQLVWVDNNPRAITIGNRINAQKNQSHIQLAEWDIFDTDISWYDYIYIFLMPAVMPRIQARLDTHLSPHTIVIVNSFPLPDRKPIHILSNIETKSKVYLYQK